jgi:hypothetical protein
VPFINLEKKEKNAYNIAKTHIKAKKQLGKQEVT